MRASGNEPPFHAITGVVSLKHQRAMDQNLRNREAFHAITGVVSLKHLRPPVERCRDQPFHAITGVVSLKHADLGLGLGLLVLSTPSLAWSH